MNFRGHRIKEPTLNINNILMKSDDYTHIFIGIDDLTVHFHLDSKISKLKLINSIIKSGYYPVFIDVFNDIMPYHQEFMKHMFKFLNDNIDIYFKKDITGYK